MCIGINMMARADEFYARVDEFCDYVPFASTISNIAALFQKLVVFPNLEKSSISNNHYYTHLDQKSFSRCVLLLVPVIGNILIGLYDVINKKYDDKDSVLEQVSPQGNVAPKNVPVKSREEQRIENIKRLAKDGVVSFYKKEFNSDTFIFGNFFDSPVTVDGITYNCKEGAFQAQKFINKEDKERFCKLGGDKARAEALLLKSLSKPCISDDDWYSRSNLQQGRVKAMEKVLRAFFAPGTHAAEALVATGDAYIVEHTPKEGRDDFWADDNSGRGKNMLGKLLMDRRKALGGIKGRGAVKPTNIQDIIKSQGNDKKVLDAEENKKS